MSLETSEAEAAAVQQPGHPRVTLDDLRANVAQVYFATADRMLEDPAAGPRREHLEILTICVLVTNCGFTIIGKSAPADPANYDRKLGRNLAREDAERQLWPLMGYALRERLHNTPAI